MKMKPNFVTVAKERRPKHLKVEMPPGGDHERVECEGCGAMRPALCITETKRGWLGDCCISDHRRLGKPEEDLFGLAASAAPGASPAGPASTNRSGEGGGS